MHKNVEIVIGRLATDPQLQGRFALDPYQVLVEQGLELSEVETTALAGIDAGMLRAFSSALDARLCRASRVVEIQPTRSETNTESESDSAKERKR
jgi:hypothetical protein